MKRTNTQKALQKEIAESYQKEVEVLSGMLKTLSDTDRQIDKYSAALCALHEKRERLFRIYSANLRRHSKSAVVYESVLKDFHEKDRDYRERIFRVREEVTKARNKLADLSWQLDNTRSFMNACRKKQYSLTKRINRWTRNIRLTYDDIYSA